MEVETGAGTTLRVAIGNPRRFVGLPPGTPITLTFSPEDAVLLRGNRRQE